MLFTKTIEKIAGRHSLINVFDDFMMMAICAFSYGKMEDQYLQIAKKYDPNELKLFAQCLAEMVEDYTKSMTDCGGWHDLLGEYFEEVNSKHQASSSGQFFTPPAICNVMAAFTQYDEDKEGRISVNDCAAGSGRNLIAHSRLVWNNRFKAFYVGQDIDFRCVKMTALNMLMFGMSGVSIHMDTLALKIYSGFRVWLPETGLGITPMGVGQCLYYLTSDTDYKEQSTRIEVKPSEEKKIIPAARIINQPVQATLF